MLLGKLPGRNKLQDPGCKFNKLLYLLSVSTILNSSLLKKKPDTNKTIIFFSLNIYGSYVFRQFSGDAGSSVLAARQAEENKCVIM